MAALAPIINAAKALYATRRDAAAGTDFDADLFEEALSDIAQAMVDANRGRPPPAPLPGMKPKALDRAIATLHDLGFTPAYTDANIAGNLGVRGGSIAPAEPAIAAMDSPSGASTTAAPSPAIGDRPLLPRTASARVSDDFDSLVDPRGSLASFEAMDGGPVPTMPAPVAQDFDDVHGLSPLNESLARPAKPSSGTAAPRHRGLPDTLSPWLGSPSDAVLAGWKEIVAGFDAVKNGVPIEKLVPNRKPRNAKDRWILYFHDGDERTRELLRARFETRPKKASHAPELPSPPMSLAAHVGHIVARKTANAAADISRALFDEGYRINKRKLDQMDAIDAGSWQPPASHPAPSPLGVYFIAKQKNDVATMRKIRQQLAVGDPGETYGHRLGGALDAAAHEVFPGDPARGGLRDAIVDAFVGNPEFDFPELPQNFVVPTATGEFEYIPIASHVAWARGDRLGQLAIFLDYFPNAEPYFDKNGDPFVQMPSGRLYYLNKSGFSMQDVNEGLLVGGMALAGGKLGASPLRKKKRIVQAAGGGVGTGAASLAIDAVAQALGSTQGYDLNRVTRETLLGAVGELGWLMVKKIFGRFVKQPELFDPVTGRPTGQGAEMLRRAGIDPEHVDRKFAEALLDDSAQQ